MIRLWRLWKHDRVMFKLYRASVYMLNRANTKVDAGDLLATELLLAGVEVMIQERFYVR